MKTISKEVIELLKSIMNGDQVTNSLAFPVREAVEADLIVWHSKVNPRYVLTIAGHNLAVNGDRGA